MAVRLRFDELARFSPQAAAIPGARGDDRRHSRRLGDDYRHRPGMPLDQPRPHDYRHGLEAVAWLAIDGDSGECAVSFALPQTSCDD
jgi:hypothetical protein